MVKNKERIKARDILNMEYPDMWAKFNDPYSEYDVVMDDGVEVMSGREICISVYFWYSAKLYPKTKLLRKNCISQMHLKSGDLLNGIYAPVGYQTRDAYKDDPDFDFEELGHAMNRHRATAYNDISTHAAPAVTTINALHYRQLYNHPVLKAIRDKLNSYDFDDPGVIMNSEIYVSEAHNDARAFFDSNDPDLQNNAIYHLCRARQVDVTPIIKQVVSIGHGCDIDSSIFPKPVTTCYLKGLRQLYDVAVDAKGGSRSLAYQADPLEQTEYANRESQILVDTVTTLTEPDCGTRNLLPWLVTAKNLQASQGMNYCTVDDDGVISELDYIKPTDHQLIGQVIYLRNAITCETKHAHGICKTCYGQLSNQLTKRTSIGRTGIFVLSSDVSQKVLSLKHDGGTAISIPIVFPEGDLKYVRSRVESQTIYLNPIPNCQKLSVSIPRKYLTNIGYIDRVKSVHSLDIRDISDVKDFSIEIIDEDGDLESRNINVSLAAKTSNLTHDFLKHLRKAEKTLESNCLTVDMEDWDFNRPILSVPRKHYSMLDFLSEFKKEVQCTDPDKANLDLSVLSNVSLALNRFNDLVGERFFINLTHLCVTMRASISNNPAGGDYRIVMSDTARFGNFKRLTPGRSIATALGHENITSFLYSTESFDSSMKQFHIYDNIVMGDK